MSPKILMRAIGYSYGGEEGQGEHKHACYVTKDGHVSRIRAQAMEYKSEAEAWEHAKAANLVGQNNDGSPWCWIEIEGT